MSLQSLPTELLYQVFQYLTYKSAAKLSCIDNLYSLSKSEIEILCFSENPLYEACRQNCSQLLNFFLNKKDYDIQTHLHAIIFYGHIKCLKFLIKHYHNFDINYQDSSGVIALHEASFYAEKECVQLLIHHGADVNIRNKYGYTALHFANETCVKLLLDHGADVNIQDNTGNTALHWACRYKKIINIEILLKYGADTSIQDNEGNTALQIANNCGHTECVRILEEYNT